MHRGIRCAAELLSQGAVSTVVCELNSEHLARQGQRPEDITAFLRDAGFCPVPLPIPRSRLHRRGAQTPAVVDVAFELAPARKARTIP